MTVEVVVLRKNHSSGRVSADYKESTVAYTLTDLKVKRVLRCLADYRKKNLQEVTLTYRRIYPASFIGIAMREHVVLSILKFLINEGLVVEEVFSYLDQALAEPVKLYSLSQAGVQHLGKRAGKKR